MMLRIEVKRSKNRNRRAYWELISKNNKTSATSRFYDSLRNARLSAQSMADQLNKYGTVVEVVDKTKED